MPQKIVAGNWKMHLTLDPARELFADLVDASQSFPDHVRVLVIPPFPFLQPLYRELPESSPIELGAQNCHEEEEGGFTGEVSAHMLGSIGAGHCIVGHSERRRDFNETDAQVLKKVRALIENEITPIVCIGESLEDRKAGKAQDHIKKQLNNSIFQLSRDEAENCIVAYEPIWAIGTGHTADPEQAQEMHAFIKELFRQHWNDESSSKISLLYGGSCKAANAEALFEQENIDGGLIGGASLKAKEFASIVRSFP